MTKREKLIWCIFGAILGVLFLLSSTDLIIKEKKAEIYPISVVLDSTTDECYACLLYTSSSFFIYSHAPSSGSKM